MTNIEIFIVAIFYILGLAIMFYAGKISGIRKGIREAIKIMHEAVDSMRGNDGP